MEPSKGRLYVFKANSYLGGEPNEPIKQLLFTDFSNICLGH